MAGTNAALGTAASLSTAAVACGRQSRARSCVASSSVSSGVRCRAFTVRRPDGCGSLRSSLLGSGSSVGFFRNEFFAVRPLVVMAGNFEGFWGCSF